MDAICNEDHPAPSSAQIVNSQKNTTNTQSSPNGSFVWKAHSKNGRTAHYFF